MMLSIDNLFFRRPIQQDAEVLLRLKNNRKASYLLGGSHGDYSPDEINEWIDFHNNKPNELLLVIEDQHTGTIIGHIGLYDIDIVSKKTELGILIADDNYRGKGYGSKSTQLMVNYAFESLGMHKVTAEVLSENIASIAMFKKCGFSIDGRLRDHVFKNGRYYDVLSMSILENER